MFTFVSIIEEK